ncbi:MAG: hypothetical protein UZ15_CFX003002305, partial [Chloroflexi bacterium OLB15]
GGQSLANSPEAVLPTITSARWLHTGMAVLTAAGGLAAALRYRGTPPDHHPQRSAPRPRRHFGDQQAAAETVERMAALKTAKARANVDMPVSASSAASNDPSFACRRASFQPGQNHRARHPRPPRSLQPPLKIRMLPVNCCAAAKTKIGAPDRGKLINKIACQSPLN